MKKIAFFLFLNFLALNSNLLAMEKRQESEGQNKQVQFTKLDWAKFGAASLGCAWFATAAAITYPAMIDKLPKCMDILMISFIPIFIAIKPVTEHLIPSSYNVHSKDKITGISTGILSALLSIGFGAYVYKKLAQLKNSKSKNIIKTL